MYNSAHFLEKNEDRLHGDVVRVIASSLSSFVVAMLPREAVAAANTSTGRRGCKLKTKGAATLGSQFKKQLNDLVATIRSTSPHFIRCMKPNTEKVCNVFDSRMILSQMRYSGLLEVCKTHKMGYPIRRDFGEFYKRYRCIHTSTSDLDGLLRELTSKGVLEEGHWVKGKTKVFMRYAQSAMLDVAREAALSMVIVNIQKHARRAVVRANYRVLQVIVGGVESAMNSRTEDALHQALCKCGELPHSGQHLAAIQKAKKLLVRVQEENRIVSLLRSAIEARDKSALVSAILLNDKMVPPFEPKCLGHAKEVVSRVKKEEQIKEKLKMAVTARENRTLTSWLDEADELNMEEDEIVRQARALQARLLEEESSIRSLKDAIEERSVLNLAVFISKCGELGLVVPELEMARKLHHQLAAELNAKNTLAMASNERSLEDVEAALAKATAAGLTAETSEEYASAKELQCRIMKENDVVAELYSAAERRDATGLRNALARATELYMAKSTEYSNLICQMESLVKLLDAETKCLANLHSVMPEDNVNNLTTTLNHVDKLGIPIKKTYKAASFLAKSKSAGAAADGLLAMTPSDSLEDIKAAIATAEKQGYPNSPELAAAKEHVALLEEEVKLFDQLVRASAETDSASVLSRALDLCSAKCAAPKYASELSAAKRRLGRLEAVEKLKEATNSALNSRDIEVLSISIATAEKKGIDTSEAKVTLAKLEEDENILAKVGKALNKKDQAELAFQYKQAMERNIDGDRMRQARMALERDSTVKLIMSTLQDCIVNRAHEAQSTPDAVLGALNDALETSMQLGLSGERVDAAIKLRDHVALMAAKLREVSAACSALRVQASSSPGITHDDVKGLHTIVAEATAAGLDTGTALADATHFCEKMAKQLDVQAQLSAAVEESPVDRRNLKAALNAAEDLELSLTVMDRARERLKGLGDEDRLQRQAAIQKHEVLQETSFNETKRVREERRARASNPKYCFQNYPNLRSPDSYAKGYVMNKKKVKDGMLKWQATSIPHSLLDLDVEADKVALHIHKSILGYTGEKSMAFPATLAQDLLRKGLDQGDVPIRDEIYLQLMKQLTLNPTPNSVALGWQIMCMCVITFPPSVDFENYLLNFLLAQQHKGSAIRNYASYCLRALEGILASGASGFVPSVEEIHAYSKRPPILATVSIVDGWVLAEDLPVTPDQDCGKVCEICAQFLELTDDRHSSFGIYVYDTASEPRCGVVDPSKDKAYADLLRTPRPLQSTDFMGDVVVQRAREKRNFKWVYKRKICLPSQNFHSDDEVFQRLMYLQAEDEMVCTGNLIIVDEACAIRQTAISMIIALTEEFPVSATDLVAMSNPAMIDFVPLSWRNNFQLEDLAQKLLTFRELLGLSAACAIPDAQDRAETLARLVDSLQKDYIETFWNHELYGAHFFPCHKVEDPDQARIISELPRDIIVAFMSTGLVLLDSIQRSVLHLFGYADIHSWGGSSSQFSLIILDQSNSTTFELKLSTAQAPDMASIILDYIKSIMAETSS